MKKFWLIDIALFQSAWFTAALLNAYAVFIMPLILALRLAVSPNWRADGRLLLLAPVGWLLDQIFYLTGVLSEQVALMPIWLMLLWCSLVLTLNHSLSWLSRMKLWQVALVGALSAPSTYYVGYLLGVFTTAVSPIIFFVAIGIGWMLVLPLLVFLLAAINRRAELG